MSEVDNIRELAERVLAHPLPGIEFPKVTLLAGRLPDESDLRVDLPSGGRAIGTVVREPGWQIERDIEVVADVPLEEEAALDFLADQLQRRGWMARAQFRRGPGGFLPMPEGGGRMLRRDDSGLTLLLTSRPIADRWSEVRLRTQWIEPGVEGHLRPPGEGLIPPLRPPAGIRLVDVSGGGGGGRWSTEAVARSSASVEDLHSHFARQLEKASWEKLSEGASGPIAWSSWKLPPEQQGLWYGYLLVLEAPGEDRRSLQLRVESERGGPGSSSMASFSSLRG